jgi:hypothetical protein
MEKISFEISVLLEKKGESTFQEMDMKNKMIEQKWSKLST